MAVFLLAIGTTESSAQQTNEGEMQFDIYIGGPNLLRAVLETSYASSGSSEEVTFGGGPGMGFRAAFLVSDKASIGVDVNYSNTKITYFESGISNGSVEEYEYVLTVPRLKAMVRFELHFGDSDNFDLYWPIAAGINKISYNFESTDPDYIEEVVELGFPVSFRTGIGGRYFFTDNIGANIEIGLGGGQLIEFGLAIKI